MDLVQPGTAQPLRLSPPSTGEGKAEASFPSLAKKHQNSPLKKSFKIPFLKKKELDSEQSAIPALLDRQPPSLVVGAGVRGLELEFRPEEPEEGLGLERRGMSGPIDGFTTPSECLKCFLLQPHVLDDSFMRCAFLFLRCPGGLASARLAALFHRFSCNCFYCIIKISFITNSVLTVKI